MQGVDDPLFISLTGVPIRFGRLVTAFFQRVTGLHINTTRIRSMEATECATLLDRNEVTVAQRDSLQKVSGHSGKTSKKFYEMLDRKRDMDNAIQIHQKMLSPTKKTSTSDAEHSSERYSSSPAKRLRQRSPLGKDLDRHNQHPRSPSSSSSSPSESRQRQRQQPRSARHDLEDSDSALSDLSDTDSPRRADSRCPPQSSSAGAYRERRPDPRSPSQSDNHLDSTVGRLHPSIANRSGTKIPWTDIEMHIVGTWCKSFCAQHGNHNVVASCLRYILNDSDIRQHFHPRHVMDNTRLRWAWEKYKKVK